MEEDKIDKALEIYKNQLKSLGVSRNERRVLLKEFKKSTIKECNKEKRSES